MNNATISSKKLSIIRDNVSKIKGYIEVLSNMRPSLYEIKNYEWLSKIEGINSILERENYFLFIGKFSSGKSSFINALLGKDLLPTASQPCTAVVTEVSFVDSKSGEGSSRTGEIYYKSDPTKGVTKTKDDLLSIIGGKTPFETGSIHHISIKLDINEFGDDLVEVYRPLVKKVILVDCPGFDSPYRFSEDILTEYVEKSSFTFYFLPSNGFGDYSDVTRLHNIRKRTATLIPVISKSDLIEDKEEREDIEEKFKVALGDIFQNEPAIFVSTYKYNEWRKCYSDSKEKQLTNNLSQDEVNKLNNLRIESGIDRIYEKIGQKSQESTLNEKKLESVLYDFNNLVDELLKNYVGEINYWQKQLEKMHFDVESQKFKDLVDYDTELSNYINIQAETADKTIKDKLVAELSNSAGKNGGDISNIIKNIIDAVFNENKEKWQKEIKRSFTVASSLSGVEIDQSKLNNLSITPDIPLSYLPMGLIKGLGNVDPLSIASMMAGFGLVGLESTIAAFSVSVPVIGTTIAVGSFLAPIAAIGGLVLAGTAIAKNVSPIRNGIIEEKHHKVDERRIEMENQLIKAQGLDFSVSIKKVLEDFKKNIEEIVTTSRDAEKQKCLNNYTSCKTNIDALELLQANTDQQLGK